MTLQQAPSQRRSRIRSLPVPGRESLAALGACTVVAVIVNWRLLRPNVLSADSLVHQYWMWRWRDPQLFTDPLTADLRESGRYPEGYEALYRVASQFVNPIAFGEWVGVGLMAVSGWLIFLIVREHTSWRPAPWIAAAVFLALIDVHRFYGGYPRGFVHPFVLLTVLLAMRRHHLGAALVAAAGALFYAPAALLAVGVLGITAIRWTDRRPQLDMRRAGFAVLALALAGVAVLLASGGAPRVLTADEARMYPEFGPQGTLRFFADSTLAYLQHNRSGFDLRTSGSILAVAALALLLVRPANFRLLRAEVLALPVVALAAWGVAQLVLFRLYLPHRYTYPLIAFFAIVVGVTLHPTWTALMARPRPRLHAFALLVAPVAVTGLAVYAFPLGDLEPLDGLVSGTALALAGGAIVLATAVVLGLGRASPPARVAIGAALTGIALAGLILFVPERLARGTTCAKTRVVSYFRSLPKDAIIAGDPADLRCIPATARRPVVISTQLAPSYEVDYFLKGRARMFATLRAQFGPSADAIAELNRRYGATHLWVKRDGVRKELPGDGHRWKARELPYGRFVQQLLESGEPAVLNLPESCRTFQNGPVEVYDIRCIARQPESA
jgi:hypothetical protein